MTRILFLADDFPPISGGISTYTNELIKNVVDEFNFTSVLTTEENGCEAFDKQQDYIIKRLWIPNIFKQNYHIKIVLMFIYAAYYVKKYKIDVIHSMAWVPYGISALMVNKIFKIPYVVTGYALELLEPQNSKLRKSLMMLVLNNAEKVVAISNYTKEILAELNIPKEKIPIIPVGVDCSKFGAIDEHRIQKLKNDFGLGTDNIILTVSTLIYSYKGHDRVIKALSQVKEKVPNLKYVIVGDGPLRKKLEYLVEELNLKDNVVFTGFVSSEDLIEFYNLCDVFVMPSSEDKELGHVEGFGIVYLEANACGKPAIGGRCGGTQDAIIDGKTGILINPLNINDIATALIKTLADKDYSQKLGEAGRQRVYKKFDWKKIAMLEANLINSIEF